jgi:HK97 gp10 family phage protein
MARIRIPRISTGNAMGTTFVGIEGLEEVINLLNSVNEKIPNRCQTIMSMVAINIQESAKTRIHSISGNLAGSFRIKRTFNEKTRMVTISAGGKAAPHAHLVEFGHRMITRTGEVVGDVPEHPFLRPAFEQYLPDLISQLESAIDNELR